MAPVTIVEDTALTLRTETSGELAPTAAEAAVQHEIQGAIVLARRFPRSEADSYAALLRSCGRTSFAEDACYSFPRGGSNVEGPSVRFAREAARVWGNIRYGLSILRDDDDSRDIEGWAWDIQTNVKVTAGDSFKKLIQRKLKNGGPAAWVKPDERDLRELTNRRGAILVRNCILQLLPADFIEDAIEETRATLKAHAVKDPDGERKKVIRAFSDIGVSPAMLESYLDIRWPRRSPQRSRTCVGCRLSIRDGNSTWSEYEKKEEKAPATVTRAQGEGDPAARRSARNRGRLQGDQAALGKEGPGRGVTRGAVRADVQWDEPSASSPMPMPTAWCWRCRN